MSRALPRSVSDHVPGCAGVQHSALSFQAPPRLCIRGSRKECSAARRSWISTADAMRTTIGESQDCLIDLLTLLTSTNAARRLIAGLLQPSLLRLSATSKHPGAPFCLYSEPLCLTGYRPQATEPYRRQTLRRSILCAEPNGVPRNHMSLPSKAVILSVPLLLQQFCAGFLRAFGVRKERGRSISAALWPSPPSI